MSRPHVPQPIVDLAHARRTARLAHDWSRADALHAAIAAAGWTVIDAGVDFDLRPLRPADVVRDGTTIHGSSESVPSRLADPPSEPYTVVVPVVAPPSAEEGAERRSAASGTAIWLPDVDPSRIVAVVMEQSPSASSGSIETIRLAGRPTPGALRNAGCRRARGTVVVVVAMTVSRDAIDRLIAGLGDPEVAIVGTLGLRSADLRRFDPIEGIAEVDPVAVSGAAIAFRRDEFERHGPFDELYRTERWLDIWWSVVLRDAGRGGASRRAVAVPDGRGDRQAALDPRGAKRDGYRFLDRFRDRPDLLPEHHRAGVDRP
ncbi:MAG: hypothetical protein IVW53_01800 [Chloroflexi bacterium]|nr:hypothetical protein [Chloroflexota bacterium]